MEIAFNEIKSEILQLLKSEAITFTKEYKDEITQFISNKLSRINLLKDLKDKIGEEFFLARMAEEKDFDTLFKNRLRIMAQAKYQNILDGLQQILKGLIQKILS